MHLSAEELVDIAEGARPEASAPHLRSCDACRRHVAALRSTMTTVVSVEVPEPSPLYWEHLSACVRDVVAAEGAPPASRGSWKWNGLPWAATAAAVALAMYMTIPDGRVASPRPADVAAAPVAVLDRNPPPIEPLGAADDPSLSIVADLTAQLDPDAAADTGWGHVGAVDEAVSNLTADERVELRRLLADALAKRGA
jgi:hypothetical protein